MSGNDQRSFCTVTNGVTRLKGFFTQQGDYNSVVFTASSLQLGELFCSNVYQGI